LPERVVSSLAVSDHAKPNTQQVARAGEHFVAGELHRRGAYAVVFSGNMPGIDVLASDRAQTRTVALQVKTKTTGTWHTTITCGRIREPVHDETRFWILIDIGEEPPQFYVVPEWWMEDSIYREHQEYLARHGGQRAQNPDSKHHGIPKSRVEEWRDRWEQLGIFDEATARS
jgi:hypothetical protein